MSEEAKKIYLENIVYGIYPDYNINAMNYNTIRRTIITTNIKYIHIIFIENKMYPLFVMNKNNEIIIPTVSIVEGGCILVTTYLHFSGNVDKINIEYNLNTGGDFITSHHHIVYDSICKGIIISFNKYASSRVIYDNNVAKRIKKDNKPKYTKRFIEYIKGLI